MGIEALNVYKYGHSEHQYSNVYDGDCMVKGSIDFNLAGN
jgi:hypothetical protein